MKYPSLLVLAGLSLLLCSTVPAADAKTNYDKNCAKCHGPDGKGNTRMGKQSGAKDYTDPKVQAELKDDKATKIIKEGLTEGGKKKMDPYGEKLNDAEIKALIEHFRAFGKK